MLWSRKERQGLLHFLSIEKEVLTALISIFARLDALNFEEWIQGGLEEKNQEKAIQFLLSH